MIKGKESHVGNIQFWVFNINHLSIKNATFWFKPNLNRTSGCGDMGILWSLKTIKNIRICHFFKPVTQNQYSWHPTHSPWSCHKCAVLQIITIICVIPVQKNFKIRASITQLLKKYQIFPKLPQIHIFTKIIIFQVYLQLFRPTASSL